MKKITLITNTTLRSEGLSVATPVKQDLRSILAIDERDGIINFVQTTIGKLVLVLLFTIILTTSMLSLKLPVVVGAAVAYAYLPNYRTLILFTATLLMLFGPQSFWFSLDGISTVMQQEHVEYLSVYKLTSMVLIGFFVCSLGVLELVRRYKTLFIARRPVVTLLAIQALLCFFASSSLFHGFTRVALWILLTVFSSYIWFLAYAIVDQRSRNRSPNLFQLGTFQPFWGLVLSLTPYGKGAAFLRKTQSKNPRDLAITQIKALKLLIWSVVLLQLKKALEWFFYFKLHIPDLESVQAAFYNTHQPYSVLLSWEALILATTFRTLRLAIYGHQAIAVARLAGFRLPRNTWRPLESRTLADFWNRYYYYFKELLVEFFFLPTFLRVFQNHPRLRMFFATFMAAGVGNAIYHFFRDIHLVTTLGLWGYIECYTSYLFYCVVLATGIGISQARIVAGFKPSETFLGKLLSFLLIWTFIICLHIFDAKGSYTLGQRFTFMTTLIGLT